MRTVKIQLAPTPKQRGLLNKQLEEHRELYNYCLELRIQAYKNNKQNISCFDLMKSEIKAFRKNGKATISNYSSLQQTIRRLDKTYQAFFRGFNKRTGFPRFKSSDRFNTVEYSARSDGNQIKKNLLYLQNIGLIKCLWFRQIIEYKSLSITRRGNTFYANFIVPNPVEIPNITEKAVGLDFGLKIFIVTSNNEKIDSPKFHRKSLKELTKIHRRIHKQPKSSRLRKKHKRTLAKVYAKVANRRRDFNHKLSRKFINGYDKIFLEDIVLKKIQAPFATINRTYNDVAFGQFKQFLTYKAENAGKIVKIVDPAYTTQECSCCGKRNELALKVRTYSCECGHTEDRDVNAAKNILRRGLASLEQS